MSSENECQIIGKRCPYGYRMPCGDCNAAKCAMDQILRQNSKSDVIGPISRSSRKGWKYDYYTKLALTGISDLEIAAIERGNIYYNPEVEDDISHIELPISDSVKHIIFSPI